MAQQPSTSETRDGKHDPTMASHNTVISPITHIKTKRASYKSISITVKNEIKDIAERLIPPHTNLANQRQLHSPPPTQGTNAQSNTPSRSPVYPDHPRIGHSQITPSLRGGDLSSETDRAKAWLSPCGEEKKTRQREGESAKKDKGEEQVGAVAFIYLI